MFKAINWQHRIKIDPAIHHGKPCIAGTRIPVSVIVGSVAEGDSWDEILTSYPQLAREDIRAALLFAAEAAGNFEMIPWAMVDSEAVGADSIINDKYHRDSFRTYHLAAPWRVIAAVPILGAFVLWAIGTVLHWRSRKI